MRTSNQVNNYPFFKPKLSFGRELVLDEYPVQSFFLDDIYFSLMIIVQRLIIYIRAYSKVKVDLFKIDLL